MAAQTLGAIYYNRIPAAPSDGRARQAGHSHNTEEMIYCKALIESALLTMAEREEFYRVRLH
jgi:hypothetical protein